MQAYAPMIAILNVSLLSVVDLIRSVIRLRRRQAAPEKWCQGWRALIGPVGLPLGLAIAWALLLLLGLPQVGGRSLPFLLLYVPDLGYMLTASAALALGWGILRAAPAFFTHRQNAWLLWRNVTGQESRLNNLNID